MNFRASLITALRGAGHTVIAIAPRDAYSEQLSSMVDEYIPIQIDSRGTNPLRDLKLYRDFLRIFKATAPDVVLGYTIKPNIYAGMAAHRLGIAVVNNISGLGATFMRRGALNALVRQMYRVALQKSDTVFFQNEDDRALFIQARIAQVHQAHLLPGSGVDLKRFTPLPWPSSRQKFRFLLISRLLWDKGVGEYVQAARIIKSRYPNTEFAVLGACGVQNPAAITRHEVAQWESEGLITYLGQSDCVEEEIARAHCVVLPSYREGTPKALLEAAACARPVMTTDAPGCRGVVIDGQSGLLCRVKDAPDLAEKMLQILAIPQAELIQMGARGRALMEQRFDERLVINEYLRRLALISANEGLGRH